MNLPRARLVQVSVLLFALGFLAALQIALRQTAPAPRLALCRGDGLQTRHLRTGGARSHWQMGFPVATGTPSARWLRQGEAVGVISR